MNHRAWCLAVLNPGLDGLILLVEVVHVGHEVLDDVHVGQRVDLGDLAVILDLGEAGQGVDTSHNRFYFEFVRLFWTLIGFLSIFSK